MQISLCMVVRDEADYLNSSIESARPVVDEIVVVDTGSKDDTPKIAERIGAQVYQSVWPGDFASAYNLFLPLAKGNWILNLDADEILDPASRSSIRTLTGDHRFDGYLLTAYNYSYAPIMKWRGVNPSDPLARGAMGYRPSQSVRLFRNHPENCYRGEVHQNIRESILARGGRIGTGDIPIHHYGWLREKRISSKFNQYFNLSKSKVKSQPRNFRAWIELGLLQLHSGDRPGAMKSFNKAKSLENEPSSTFFLGHLLIERGRPHKAIGYLKEALQKNPGDNASDFDHADAYEEMGQAYEMLGDPQDAETSYQCALFSRPDSPVASNNLAGLLSMRGSLKEANTILEKLLNRYPRLDLAWTTLGTNRLRSGDLQGARTAFETALKINPKNVPSRENLAFVEKMVLTPRIKITDLPNGVKVSQHELKKLTALREDDLALSKFKPKWLRRFSSWHGS